MSLNTIFKAVNALLPAGTKTDVGAERAYDNVPPPRVVWVPTTERFEAFDGHGGDGVTSKRALAQRVVEVNVLVFGADQDAVEVLLDQVWTALYDAVRTGLSMDRGEWVRRQGDVELGRLYVLTVELKIPVTRPLPTTATVTSIPITTDPSS
jgi:phenylpyruvate tautomerase PptA (4-oxalocrotonate tautomerase family)